MLSVKAAMKRHSVLIYFALVFVFSFGGILLVAGPEGFPLRADQFESFGPLLYLGILAGPCLAGILLTALVDGPRGLRDLLSRLSRWARVLYLVDNGAWQFMRKPRVRDLKLL